MSMTAHRYEYATLQLVPSSLADHRLSVGVILHARSAEYLDLRVAMAPERWTRLMPDLDVEMAARALGDLVRICRGGPGGGAIGLLPPGERFHWLTTTRSAVVRPSAVRGGRCRDPEAMLQHIFNLIERHGEFPE